MAWPMSDTAAAAAAGRLLWLERLLAYLKHASIFTRCVSLWFFAGAFMVAAPQAS